MKIRGNTIGTPIKPEKNLVKATGLSAEEQAQARENIGAASADVIGDIDTALDTIIAIQEELMGGGGGGMVEFDVNGEMFTAEPGMTWREFINSEYNPQMSEACVDCHTQGNLFWCDDAGVYAGCECSANWVCNNDDDGTPVFPDDVITSAGYFY